jgi:Glycosyl transferase family 64 domain
MVLKAMTALKRHFLIAQFYYLFRTYHLRKTWRHKLVTFAEAGNLLLRYSWLRFMLRFGSAPSRADGKSCAVVLLSHNRPQNLPILIKGALRSGFVSKIVVSNSNPKVSLEDWINLEDSRLLLIDESEPTQPGHRLVLARETGAKYVLAIDDDIFFTPGQWRNFFGLLLVDEHCPHGIIGHLYRPGTTSSNGSPFHHVVGRETDVDVLIGAYAFTSEHVNRVFELAAKIGVSDLSRVRNGDDILLSFGGIKPPRIHPLKPALVCASASLPGIALWKSDHEFWNERVRVFENARDARLAMNSPWPKQPRLATEEARS